MQMPTVRAAAYQECAGGGEHAGQDTGLAGPVVRGGQVVGAPPGHHPGVCPAAALQMPSRPCPGSGQVRLGALTQPLCR